MEPKTANEASQESQQAFQDGATGAIPSGANSNTDGGAADHERQVLSHAQEVAARTNA